VRVLCAGHVNWDVTLRLGRLPVPDGESRVKRRQESGGGSAANVAVALAALDRAAALVGSVGEDPAGERALSSLAAAGVDVSLVRTVQGTTARKYLLVDEAGEVAMVDDGGVNEAIAPEDVDAAWLDDITHLHLTGQRPATAARLAGLASDRGVGVSFDPGRRLDDRDYTETLARTDLLLLNDREADALDAEALPRDCVVVTKHGERGATLEGPDGRLDHEGVALSAVDATGAGDAFAAGFLAASLDGADDERALAVANACGALAANGEGPRADLSWDRVAALLAD
jgi:ribokinase